MRAVSGPQDTNDGSVYVDEGIYLVEIRLPMDAGSACGGPWAVACCAAGRERVEAADAALWTGECSVAVRRSTRQVPAASRPEHALTQVPYSHGPSGATRCMLYACPQTVTPDRKAADTAARLTCRHACTCDVFGANASAERPSACHLREQGARFCVLRAAAPPFWRPGYRGRRRSPSSGMGVREGRARAARSLVAARALRDGGGGVIMIMYWGCCEAVDVGHA